MSVAVTNENLIKRTMSEDNDEFPEEQLLGHHKRVISQSGYRLIIIVINYK